jgi:hypothetical protein
MSQHLVFRRLIVLILVFVAIYSVFKLNSSAKIVGAQLSSFATIRRDLQSAELSSLSRLNSTTHERPIPLRFRDNPAYQPNRS